MLKKKVVKKQAASVKAVKSKDFKSVKEDRSMAYLLDEKNVGVSMLECLKNNDPEGVIQVLETYLKAMNKANFLKQTHVHYRFKNRNPTLKTLAKLIHKSYKK